MPEDAGQNMKDRLRADLRTALKARRATEAQVIRTLLAAIDNAEAPPIRAEKAALVQHSFRSGSAEVERLRLSRYQVQSVLMTEIHERDRAAAELERLEMVGRAEALRAEAVLAKRYLD